jgi:adenine deaminase
MHAPPNPVPDLVAVARGLAPADLRLDNVRVVNVFTGEILPTPVALAGGQIAALGPVPAREVLDLEGRFLAPGFIDPHVHIESSLADPAHFARAILPRGTTTVVADPHEIANVLGTAGLDYMLAASAGLPLEILFGLPSCVPATSLETAGAALTAADLAPYFSHPRVCALGEMMNVPGVLAGDPEVRAKLDAARRTGRRREGHAPGLTGTDLQAYVAAGIQSDHECTRLEEAREKLRLGMRVMIREGSAARNLDDLLPLVTPATVDRVMWCTDDRHPHDILEDGHLDALVRRAIAGGLDPLLAIRAATLSPARYFGLHDRGAVAPGRRGDLVAFRDLREPVIDRVFAAGRLAAADGRRQVEPWPAPVAPPPHTFRLAGGTPDFRVPARGRRLRVIGIVPGQIVTRHLVRDVSPQEGLVEADAVRDLAKLALLERHQASGRVGLGFVEGLGLTAGALASSVAHDSHNLVVAGVNDRDMAVAAARVADLGGGLAVAWGGEVRAELPLPIAGLMTPRPLEDVRQALDRLNGAARQLGCRLADPFMTLSFLALPVIPELKLTDRGLVDVTGFAPVDLFAGD